MSSKTIMEAKDVIEIVRLLEKENIDVWLDGGWAVDALLRKQTRSHSDLDIVIQQKDVPKLRRLLRGYADAPRNDPSAWNFAIRDNKGREVDVHVIVFDKKGNGLYGPKKRGIMYPADSLTGTGTVQGRSVKCISAEYLVKFHSGYELKEEDFKDVYALHKRFGIALPSEYNKFMDQSKRRG